MLRNVTICDIADALNLTPATVSRALNDSYQISEQTKIRVRTLADEWNYRPNRMAKGLRSNKTMLVGVLMPSISYYFNSSAISGIEETLIPKGYRVIICQTGEKLQREIANLNDLYSIGVDGLIASLSSETINIEHFKPFISSGRPIIFLDRVPTLTNYPKVIIDNVKIAYTAVSQLLKTGRRKIVWMAGPQGLMISDLRYEGYCQAHREAGLSVDDQLKINSQFDSQSSYRELTKLLTLRADIDGVLSVNDQIAIEALASVRDFGKRVPEDVAIMGINNDPMTALVYPALTTMRQPANEMGKFAAQLLLKQMMGKLVESRDYVFETQLVERKSTILPTL
jgi:DNA-binding LacI/PurR family transcriptional regulator